MGNGNGEHAALWEVCRAFKGLKKNSMCATGYRKQEEKQIKPTSLFAPGFYFLASTRQKVHLKLKYFYVQETAD